MKTASGISRVTAHAQEKLWFGRSRLDLAASELARQLAGTGVTSNSLHPGGVATNIWSGAPWWSKPLIALFVGPRLISIEAGAATIVQLAASTELEGVSGRYFEEQRPVEPAPLAQDAALARRLWLVSETLTGETPSSIDTFT